MRITSLSCQNYRILENIAVHFPTDYCTLSGHNNAGKSSIIRLLRLLLEQHTPSPISLSINYLTDRTQWVTSTDPISVQYELCLNHSDDSSLVNFISKYSKLNISESEIKAEITISVDSDNKRSQSMKIHGVEMQEPDTREILRKLRSSNSLFVHNSAVNSLEFFLLRGGGVGTAYPILLSPEEYSAIEAAEQSIQKKIKKLTKVHKQELDEMIGKLRDKYNVELSTTDRYSSRRMPFDINLSDKSARVPLDDWGSGTQNRTRILMSVLQAKRTKASANNDDRNTPIVVVEEPESFLHPTAQAEFGALLQALSAELKIQIIAATHSPYMLNQVNPSSNILLRRKSSYKKFLGSEIVDTAAGDWMAPFAEHLGVIPPEFDQWRAIFAKHGAHLLLVEGDIDKEYIDHLRNNHKDHFDLPSAIEVMAYNGKDALKNVALLKFVLSRVQRAFITFDLDAADEVKKPLLAIGLEEGNDFTAVGLPKPGKEAIEGLLPERVLAAVNGRETDLIMQLSAKDGSARKEAKKALKKRYLDEFKKTTDLTEEELEPLAKLGRVIIKQFAISSAN